MSGFKLPFTPVFYGGIFAGLIGAADAWFFSKFGTKVDVALIFGGVFLATGVTLPVAGPFG